MFERDYLMRQLMQLFEVLQKIMRYRKKGEKGKALEQVQFFYASLKLEELPGKLSVEEMMKLLVYDKKLTNEQLELLACVLKEQGEMEESETLRLDCFRKAWFLLDKVERESVTFSMDRLMRLGELKEYLN
ncbi:MAG TPA: hypothetical protein PK167_06990 [Prolixibacteraceae bacterium]|nr:hypothetical protein [Prolixibacteraceae bacterium]